MCSCKKLVIDSRLFFVLDHRLPVGCTGKSYLKECFLFNKTLQGEIWVHVTVGLFFFSLVPLPQVMRWAIRRGLPNCVQREGLAQQQQGLHLKLPQLQRWPDFKGPAFAVQLSTTLGLVDLRLGLSIYPTTATRTSTKHELPSKLDSILLFLHFFWTGCSTAKKAEKLAFFCLSEKTRDAKVFCFRLDDI